MNKRILIVNKSFATGGIQSSMVNMANILCEFYDVDLFLYYPQGTMRSRVSSKVHVLSPNWRISVLAMSAEDVFRSKKVKYILFKIVASVWAKCFGNQIPIAHAFRHQEKLTGYDLAIAYHHEQPQHSLASGYTKFINTKVESKKKAAWLHFDPSQLHLNIHYCMGDYQKMDKIFCVSKSLKEKAKEAYPLMAEKLDYCYNFLDTANIRAMSLAELPFAIDDETVVCFSACRLSKEKALVRAVHCLAPVLKTNPDVIWYIAGDGVEYDNIQAAIMQNQVEDQIELIGHQDNPYSFMKRANLVMNLSFHEAAPMVFLESLLLGVPVFATETSSAEEFAEFGSMFHICPNHERGITQSFENLINQKSSLREMKVSFDYDLNDESLEKIKSLICREA